MNFDEKARDVADSVLHGKFYFPALAPAISAALKEAVGDAEKPLIDQLNKAFQRIQVLEEIKFNLEKAVKSKPIPWAHDIRSRKESSDV